ncbi:MAG: PQQ-binding-like beta-propeller repeat protein [Planctomycetes bacterium]|nr:PQQ-binding-like beta-propeller repeat protein [Planctomycetota bacterium]
MLKNLLVCSCVLMGAIVGAVSAEDWPGWRGPRGDGTSLETNVPVRWNGPTGENIAWKVPLPGQGHASPIVWGDYLFLISCIDETQERVLLCLDRRDGSTRWRKTVFTAPLETKHVRNSYASGTPATDGELVYVALLQVDGSTIPAPNVGNARDVTPGKIVVAAYDFDGDLKWTASPGEFISAHGFCSCPVLYQDLVIINGDHDGQSYIAALKKGTGELAWKVPRLHQTRSYVTPIIRDIAGRTQMVLSGSKHIASYDPRDGSQHWMISGPTEQYVASMVYDGKRFFMAAGFPTYHVMAIRPDGAGEVTDTHVEWHSTGAKCYVPSPVVVGKYLLVADDRGTGNCFDAATGERLWQARLGRAYGSSLVTAGGLVYFLADDGVTKVIVPGKELKIVAENELGELCSSSPAISQGRIYIRGEKHLWAIGGVK